MPGSEEFRDELLPQEAARVAAALAIGQEQEEKDRQLKQAVDRLGANIQSARQLPSIGRVVHYRSWGTPGGEYLPEPRAAIITEVGIRNVAEGKLDKLLAA